MISKNLSQNNNAARKCAAQKRGGALKRAAPFLVVVLKFESIFLKDFAWLFGWLDSLLAYALGWLFPWMLATPDFRDRFLDRPMEFYSIFPNFSKVSWQKHFFGERIMIHHRFSKIFFTKPLFPQIGFSIIGFCHVGIP